MIDLHSYINIQDYYYFFKSLAYIWVAIYVLRIEPQDKTAKNKNWVGPGSA